MVFVADEARLLYNSARAHDLAAAFNDKLHFDMMQPGQLEKTQHRVQDKRTRLESQAPGDFDTLGAIRAGYRMSQDLIWRTGNFTPTTLH